MSTIQLTSDRIHDAARAAVLELGVRRTTLVEVARRAEVSRMSIYRRYPDVDALLRDVLTAEFGGMVARASARGGAGDGRTRLVEEVFTAVGEIRASPLWQKIAGDEPLLLMPYVLERIGTSQRLVLAVLRQSIVDGQADGSIRPHDPDLLAHGVLLIAQSFVHSAGIAEIPALRLLEELPVILAGYLSPQPASATR
jgi:AcrR family transcriptional regulator